MCADCSEAGSTQEDTSAPVSEVPLRGQAAEEARTVREEMFLNCENLEKLMSVGPDDRAMVMSTGCRCCRMASRSPAGNDSTVLRNPGSSVGDVAAVCSEAVERQHNSGLQMLLDELTFM